MEHTATYSPDDNKLRLYPACRLSAAEYAAARAAGFIWAPKQELFVAPMWTPEREDYLLSLCESIEDEDRSLVERAEERAERFEEYSDKRGAEAERAREAVSAIADNIPLGQPILVGHHSERHARRDAERIESGMRRAVQLWKTSTYWEQRARGALRAAKYKERADVRARRIKRIEADIRKCERNIKDADGMLRAYELIDRPDAWRDNSDGTKPTREERALSIAGRYHLVVRVDHDGPHMSWTAYDVLRAPEDRYNGVPEVSIEEVIAAARTQRDRVAAINTRWLEHYRNRLTYERAMLDDQGGTVADAVKPEKGGAVQCWASRTGGWSYIQKVNKVSVTILDRWSNSQKPFKRTIEFDKLTKIMSAAQVTAAMQVGRIVGSDEIGFILLDETPPEPPKDTSTTTEKSESAEAFKAMQESLSHGVQIVTANQLFPTPIELAERMAAALYTFNVDDPLILEPSAGTGALVRAVRERRPGARFVLVEKNVDLCQRLEATFSDPDTFAEIIRGDFLELWQHGPELFDRVIMNPPFEDASDIKHILHAFRLLKPGGRMVALCADGPRQRDALIPWATERSGLYQSLGAQLFAGTSVRVAMVTAVK